MNFFQFAKKNKILYTNLHTITLSASTWIVLRSNIILVAEYIVGHSYLSILKKLLENFVKTEKYIFCDI